MAASYNNIGIVYESQGRYDEALQEYEKCLKIQVDKLGHEHPVKSEKNPFKSRHRQKEVRQQKTHGRDREDAQLPPSQRHISAPRAVRITIMA